MSNRKRSAPPEEVDDDQDQIEVDDVEREEKDNHDNDDDDDDEDDEPVQQVGEGKDISEMSFLDTFYELSSASPKHRADAAQVMLNHCLLGPQANAKDAAYAFSRLLSGLCSGRAAARQGFASALTSFLKISHQKGVLSDIYEGKGDSHVLAVVRDELLKATDTSTLEGGKHGKKKGSEERDHHFGRLFGILGVIRSGVLLPRSDQVDLDKTKEVVTGFAQDLIELYNHRKWMREPAAFALINLMDSFYNQCPQTEAIEVVKHLVSEVVVPNMLSGSSVVEYTAEQIAVAIDIQAQCYDNDISFPPLLQEAILSKDHIPMLADVLSSTSFVSQPRIHVVWDVMLCPYLSVPANGSKTKGRKTKWTARVLRDKIPGGKDAAADVVGALVEYVVAQCLLGVDAEAGPMSSGTNATHERRALALSLVKVLSGGDSVSAKSEGYRLILDGTVLESVVLTPLVVQKLFIDVICASSGKHPGHLLKPMALDVLEAVVVGHDSFSTDNLNRRLACAKAFLSCDPRFDRRTKSFACERLLMLNVQMLDTVTTEHVDIWGDYIEFLCLKVVQITGESSEHNDDVFIHDATGYVELLYGVAKFLFRLVSTEEAASSISSLYLKVLAFFFVCAFFDCSKFSVDTKELVEEDVVILSAKKATASRSRKAKFLPYPVRVIMSARFFSLLADVGTVSSQQKAPGDREATATTRTDALLDYLTVFSEGWNILEAKGCTPFGKEIMDTDAPHEPDEDVLFIAKQREAALSRNQPETLRRFRSACASLNSVLHLHTLKCGNSELLDDNNSDAILDNDDDEAETFDLISEIASAQHKLLVELGICERPDGHDVDNALLDLAEVCAATLSSETGVNNPSRGALPRLLKETVKDAWSSALALCSEHMSEVSMLDESLLGLLLAAIGAMDNEDDEGEEPESYSDEEGSEEGNEEGDAVFTKIAATRVDLEDDDIPDGADSGDEEDNAEEDVELDPSQLQTMLLQDSDDEDEHTLEHHSGADTALARFIKIKQEARKAGQLERKRIELTKQLRSLLLLEILLSGRQLKKFPQSFVLGLFLPLLVFRRRLERSVLAASKLGKKSGIADSERRSMVEKLTSLMKAKLFKLKNIAPGVISELTETVSLIMVEARKARTEDQQSCCGASLVALCKMTESVEDLVSLSSLFSDLVGDWTTKRRTRLKSTVLEVLCHQQPSIAQVLLVLPLCDAATNARSPYLKSEIFRLLSLLVSNPPNGDDLSELEERSIVSVRESIGLFSKGVMTAIVDPEMKKTKRLRDVLRTTEKFAEYLKLIRLGSSDSLDSLLALSSAVTSLKEQTENQGIRSLAESVIKSLNQLVSESRAYLEKTTIKPADASINAKKKKKKKRGKK